MAIKIDKGIPLQERSKYPFSDMKPGDSFLVEGESGRASAINSFNYWKSKDPKRGKLICKTRKDGAAIRVWVVAEK